MISFSPPDGVLDLAETLDCGQAFRFAPSADGFWRGVAFGHLLGVKREQGGFVFDCTQKEFDEIWFDYFDFERDYAAVRKALSALHPVLAEAMEFSHGIRILRQEPWEALCTFIFSQNNNIPRIKGLVARISALCGAEIADGVFAFPTAERIAALDEAALAPVRAGFRTKYILDAARRVATGKLDLEAVRNMPIEDARAALQTVHGVGPKVAECVLLYGLHRLECFPLDVWMRRAMTLFPGLTPADFGQTAGIAQQYIFHFARMSSRL